MGDLLDGIAAGSPGHTGDTTGGKGGHQGKKGNKENMEQDETLQWSWWWKMEREDLMENVAGRFFG